MRRVGISERYSFSARYEMKPRKTMATVWLNRIAEREGADHPPPGVGSRGEFGIALARIAPAQDADDDGSPAPARHRCRPWHRRHWRECRRRAHGAWPWRLGLADDGARAIEHGQRREQQHRREIERAPSPGAMPDPKQHREQAEGEGAIALAERPVIASPDPEHRPERAGHLGDDAGHHHQHHERRVEPGDQREREDRARRRRSRRRARSAPRLARSPARAPSPSSHRWR